MRLFLFFISTHSFQIIHFRLGVLTAGAGGKVAQVYVNGVFCSEDEARISVFDRGFLFADSIYEVTTVLDGCLIDHDLHAKRLQRSLDALGIRNPVSMPALLDIQRKLVADNQLQEGIVYMQVTRGSGERDFGVDPDMTPSLVVFTQAKSLLEDPNAKTGIKVISYPDLRWLRRDIKTTNLLPATMAKQAAKEQGKHDAWLVDEQDAVTEGVSNNAFIVTRDNELVTRRLSSDILHGITREVVLCLAADLDIKVVERSFTIAEAQAAKEAFITSASTFVYPVIEVADQPIGNGEPGPVAQALRERYIARALAQVT